MELLDTTVARPHSTDPTADKDSLVRSYLMMRVVIGGLGLALPVLLIVGDIILLKGSPKARGSLSAYYHSGMRDEFVGILVVTGFFLITYKLLDTRAPRENLYSTLAGIAAIGVAIFPTGRPGGSTLSLTPVQERLGEHSTKVVHFTCAVVFIVLLAVISIGFGKREGKRTRGPNQRHGPAWWTRFHFVCAACILGSLVFWLGCSALGVLDGYKTLVTEVIALVAFGLSWLMKGYERDLLFAVRGTRSRLPAAAAEAA